MGTQKVSPIFPPDKSLCHAPALGHPSQLTRTHLLLLFYRRSSSMFRARGERGRVRKKWSFKLAVECKFVPALALSACTLFYIYQNSMGFHRQGRRVTQNPFFLRPQPLEQKPPIEISSFSFPLFIRTTNEAGRRPIVTHFFAYALVHTQTDKPQLLPFWRRREMTLHDFFLLFEKNRPTDDG